MPPAIAPRSFERDSRPTATAADAGTSAPVVQNATARRTCDPSARVTMAVERCELRTDSFDGSAWVVMIESGASRAPGACERFARLLWCATRDHGLRA